MGFGMHVHCPIADDALFMVDEDDHTVGLYHTLACRYQISILDICKMLGYALYGPDDEAANSPEVEIKDRIRDFERDANLLKLELPIEEAIAIWMRAREGLQWLADHCPERREEIEAFLAERERRMEKLRARLGRH